MASIRYKDTEVPIVITYQDAWTTFKDLGLNLLSVFSDDATIQRIMTDDELMVPVWYHFVKNHTSDSLEDALANLTPEKMTEFREEFWNAVINFTPPLLRPSLLEFTRMMKEELQSPQRLLKKGLSESLEEQESIQGTTPSGNSSQ